MQNGAIRVLVVGVGNMGLSHALAYDKIEGFELVGLCSRSIRGRNDLPAELASLPRYENVDEALAESRPDAVSINTYPNTHEELCIKAFDAGCHVFVEKPLATTVDGAQAVVDKARADRQEAGHRLHPARPPGVAGVHQARPHARQAAGHAHEPQPAEPGAGLELAPQPDGIAHAASSIAASTTSMSCAR